MYRLIYRSIVTNRLDKESFRDILYTSAQENQKNGITGALLATPNNYLQILEGEHDKVHETFKRIANDPRHSSIERVYFKPVKKRLFPQWNMRGFGIFNLNSDLERALVDKYGEEGGSFRFPNDEKTILSLFREVDMLDGNSGGEQT